MDIPLPEELELLEANYQDLEPPEEEPPDSPPCEINAHKRPRADAPDSPIEDDQPKLDDKRTRIVDDVDEDWLRYSPPQEREDSGVAVEEKFVSRYASEIDGDFLPVTAPSGGDRVYVKICRIVGEDRGKKLDIKSRSNGTVEFFCSVKNLQILDAEKFFVSRLIFLTSKSH